MLDALRLLFRKSKRSSGFVPCASAQLGRLKGSQGERYFKKNYNQDVLQIYSRISQWSQTNVLIPLRDEDYEDHPLGIWSP